MQNLPTPQILPASGKGWKWKADTAASQKHFSSAKTALYFINYSLQVSLTEAQAKICQLPSQPFLVSWRPDMGGTYG